MNGASVAESVSLALLVAGALLQVVDCGGDDDDGAAGAASTYDAGADVPCTELYPTAARICQDYSTSCIIHETRADCAAACLGVCLQAFEPPTSVDVCSLGGMGDPVDCSQWTDAGMLCQCEK